MRVFCAHDHNRMAVSLVEGDRDPNAVIDLARTYGAVFRTNSGDELFPVRLPGQRDINYLTAEQLRDRLSTRAA